LRRHGDPRRARGLARAILATSVIAAGAAVAAPGPESGEPTAVMAEGESLRDLAMRTLGDADLAELIGGHNGVTRPSAGAELRLPAARPYQVQGGDTWPDLAARFWGGRDRAAYLALFSGQRASEPPPVGQQIWIPALARYRLRRGETLAHLSRTFLHDVAFASALAGLNRFENPRRLRIGTPVLVPVRARVRGLTQAPAAPEADDAEAPKPAPLDDARQEISPASMTQPDLPSVASPAASEHTDPILEAVNRYLDGDFSGALERFERLRAPVLESGTELDRSILLRHLIYVYVAFDRYDDACVMNDALNDVEERPEWDPDLVSPRILAALRACPRSADAD
jgi:hypothetical protein